MSKHRNQKVAGTTQGIGLTAEMADSLDEAPGRRYVIYAIACAPSGKRYVGRSVNERLRWQHHKSALKHNKHWCAELQSDWNYFGRAAFSFHILEECEDKEAAHLAEIKHTTLAACYNYLVSNKDGDGMTTLDAAREKQSIAIKAAWADPDSGLRNPIRTRWDDPKQRLIQSRSQRRRYEDPEERKRTAEATKAAITLEGRATRSVNMKASWSKPNSPQRLAIPKRAMSAEGIAVKAAKMRDFWASPEGLEIKERRSKRLRELWADPDSLMRNRKPRST